MQHPSQPTESPLETDATAPAPTAGESDFAERRDDPQQAEELERQQDA